MYIRLKILTFIPRGPNQTLHHLHLLQPVELTSSSVLSLSRAFVVHNQIAFAPLLILQNRLCSSSKTSVILNCHDLQNHLRY
jgi:hypothetical protein